MARFVRRSWPGLGVPLLLGGMALAVAAAGPTPARPYRLPENLRDYFDSRYGLLREDSLVSTLVATPDGPTGSLTVYLKGTGPEGPIDEERADAIARGFLRNEMALLDIPDMEEIRKQEVKDSTGGDSVMHYQRFIGGILLADTSYRVHVNTAGSVTSLHAALAPTPVALYAAADRGRISEEKARAIAAENVGKYDHPQIREARLSAQGKPPWILWLVSGRIGPGLDYLSWTLGIDAFTGKIEKRFCSDGRVYIRAPTGPQPCDDFMADVPPRPKSPAIN